MSIGFRQVKFYTEICSIYRANLEPGSNGEQTYSVVSTGNPCKLYTTPNFNIPAPGGGIVMSKENNIFTDNKLHLDPTVDIQPEDMVQMTTSLNVGGKPWFRVAGAPYTRQGVANRSEVYLQPDVAPVIV